MSQKFTTITMPFRLSARAFARFEELTARGYSLARIVGIGLYAASVAEKLPVNDDDEELLR